MELWSLPDPGLEELAAKVREHQGDLTWGVVAVRDQAGTCKAFSVTVRDSEDRVPPVTLDTGKVVIHTEPIEGAEAAERLLRKSTGSIPEIRSELLFELIGDHGNAHWLTPLAGNFGLRGNSQWPQLYGWWSFGGTQDLEQRLNPWEPVQLAPPHIYDNLFTPVWNHIYAAPYPGGGHWTNIPSQLGIRLNYPVKLGIVAPDDSGISVEVLEAIAGAAAGHSLHLTIRDSLDDPGFTPLNAAVSGAETVRIPHEGRPFQLTVSLLDKGNVRRDSRDQSMAARTTSFVEAQPSVPAHVIYPVQARPTEVNQPPTTDVAVNPQREPPPDFSPICRDQALAELLAERWEEAQRAIGAQAYLAAVVITGSLLEGALYAAFDKHEATAKAHGPHDKKGDPKPLVEWTMSELIDAALKGKWIELEIKKFSDSLRDYRNLVHPQQQLKLATKPTEATSDICWRVASHALKQLVSRAAGAQASP
jgi:hypothetical protein